MHGFINKDRRNLQTDTGLYQPTLVPQGSDGLMDKVSVSQPRDLGFEPHTGHDYDTSYDTSTGWFQEADSKMII